MTTVSLVEKECFICGNKSRQAEAGIRWNADPYDLDLRPTGAMRSSIYMWMQRCLGCGYCAPNIGRGPSPGTTAAETRDVVDSEQYRTFLTAGEFSDSVGGFLCWSLLAESIDDFNKAGWAALHGAWVCDDDPRRSSVASECRRRALYFIEKARLANQNYADTPFQEELLKIDLLRRLGYFDQAAAAVEKEQRSDHSRRGKCILAYEEDLIEARDDRCHTISEALEDSDCE